MKKRFTGEQTSGFLRERDVGLPVRALALGSSFPKPAITLTVGLAV